MTLQDEIASAARTIAEGRRQPSQEKTRKFRLPLLGTFDQGTLELLKMFFFCLGFMGILSGQRFLTFINNVNPGLGGFFSRELLGIPIAMILFSGALLLAFIIAKQQRNEDITSRERADEAALLISGLAEDLGKGGKTVYVGKEVLNELVEVKTILSGLSADMDSLKGGSRRGRKRMVKARLKTELKPEPEPIVEEPLDEFNLLKIGGVGPKAIEKLNKLGVHDASDLLKVPPNVLVDGTGYSYRVIAKWVEDAAKILNT